MSVASAHSPDASTHRVTFVTGAAGGIGRATALAFARRGDSVAVADRDGAGVQALAAEITKEGGSALAVECDVTSGDSIRAALSATVERFGRLDYAFNNAGIEQKSSRVADLSEPEWNRVITVDLTGVFLAMKYEIPIMLDGGGGAIVNTSSGAGLRAWGGGAAYVAAKHGVIGLTKEAAMDYVGSNLRINAVCPGIIDTKMIERVSGGTSEGLAQMLASQPMGRMGRPEEIAAAVLWLCSDSATFVTGHALVADGGQTI